MRQLARDGARDLRVRHRAIALVQDRRQKDFCGEACALLKYVRDSIRYVRDINGVEVLQIPARTMQTAAGDCDDKCILLAAMLLSIGHTVRFIACSQIADRFSHVWLQAFIDGRWLDLEPTEPIDCGQRVPYDGIASYIVQEV